MSDNKPQFSFNAQVYNNQYQNPQSHQQPQIMNYNSMTPGQKVVAYIKAGDIDNLKNYVESFTDKQSILNDLSPELKQNCIFSSVQYQDEQRAIQMTKYLIDQGASFKIKDIHGQTPLFYVAKDGRIGLLNMFFQYQIDVNEVDSFSQSCLFYAAREGRDKLILELIKHGLNVNLKDRAKQTALFYAAREGKLSTCKILVENGSNINETDNRKQTPLFFAKKANKQDVVDYFLNNGAQEMGNGRSSKTQTKNKGSVQSIQAKQQKQSSKKNTKNQQKVLYKIMIADNQLSARDFNEEDFAKLKAQFPEVAKLLLNPDMVNQNDNIYEKLDQETWQEIANKIIKNLWKCKGANIFHEPVDPQALGIPTYFDIVKNPMDFGTIKKKLQMNVYEQPQNFKNDVNQVFQNCKLFNGEESYIGQIGVKTKEQFERLLIDFDFDRLFDQNDNMRQDVQNLIKNQDGGQQQLQKNVYKQLQSNQGQQQQNQNATQLGLQQNQQQTKDINQQNMHQHDQADQGQRQNEMNLVQNVNEEKQTQVAQNMQNFQSQPLAHIQDINQNVKKNQEEELIKTLPIQQIDNVDDQKTEQQITSNTFNQQQDTKNQQFSSNQIQENEQKIDQSQNEPQIENSQNSNKMSSYQQEDVQRQQQPFQTQESHLNTQNFMQQTHQNQDQAISTHQNDEHKYETAHETQQNIENLENKMSLENQQRLDNFDPFTVQKDSQPEQYQGSIHTNYMQDSKNQENQMEIEQEEQNTGQQDTQQT